MISTESPYRAVTPSAIRVSFEPGTRWSTSTPSRRLRAGSELGNGRGQVVQAVDRFDDDALDPQVVTPDPLDQGGVMDALDPDPGGPGGAGPQPGDHPRSGGRSSAAGRAASGVGPG